MAHASSIGVKKAEISWSYYEPLLFLESNVFSRPGKSIPQEIQSSSTNNNHKSTLTVKSTTTISNHNSKVSASSGGIDFAKDNPVAAIVEEENPQDPPHESVQAAVPPCSSATSGSGDRDPLFRLNLSALEEGPPSSSTPLDEKVGSPEQASLID